MSYVMFEDLSWVVRADDGRLIERFRSDERVLAEAKAVEGLIVVRTKEGGMPDFGEPEDKASGSSGDDWMCGNCGSFNALPADQCWNCKAAKNEDDISSQEAVVLTVASVNDVPEWSCPTCDTINPTGTNQRLGCDTLYQSVQESGGYGPELNADQADKINRALLGLDWKPTPSAPEDMICPECGGQINQYNYTCEECGAKQTGGLGIDTPEADDLVQQYDTEKCPECGQDVLPEDDTCP